MRSLRLSPLLLGLLCLFHLGRADGAENPNHPFDGGWALYLPGGAAGWLSVETHGPWIHAKMLWGWGSVFDLDEARLAGEKLLLTRSHEANGKTGKIKLKETITVTRTGDSLSLVSVTPKADGTGEDRAEFTGK